MVAKCWGHKVERQWSRLSRGLQSVEEPREPVTTAAFRGRSRALSGLNQLLPAAHPRLLLGGQRAVRICVVQTQRRWTGVHL